MKYHTSTTQFNCGIDLHGRQMYVCLMDRDGKKLVHTNIRNNDFAYFLKLVAPCDSRDLRRLHIKHQGKLTELVPAHLG